MPICRTVLADFFGGTGASVDSDGRLTSRSLTDPHDLSRRVEFNDDADGLPLKTARRAGVNYDLVSRTEFTLDVDVLQSIPIAVPTTSR